MKRRDYIEAIPLILIFLCFIYTLINVIDSDSSFSTRTIIGFSSAILLVPIFFINRRLYKIFLGLLLIAGTLNLISFSIWISMFGFFINGKMIGIQMLSVAILIVYVKIFKNDISSFYKTTFKPKELNEQQLIKRERDMIEVAKMNLEYKSKEELILISADLNESIETRQAAIELLNNITLSNSK